MHAVSVALDNESVVVLVQYPLRIPVIVGDK